MKTITKSYTNIYNELDTQIYQQLHKQNAASLVQVNQQQHQHEKMREKTQTQQEAMCTQYALTNTSDTLQINQQQQT